MDLSFAAPHWLWGLLALPVLALFEWRAVTRSRRAHLPSVSRFLRKRLPNICAPGESRRAGSTVGRRPGRDSRA